MTLWLSAVPPLVLSLFILLPYAGGVTPIGFLFGGRASEAGGTEQAGIDGNHQVLNGSSHQKGTIPVRVVRLDSMQPDSMVQRFSGVILPRRSSRLAAKQLARVVQVHVNMGDSVEADQLLVELDAREVLAEREMLNAQLLGAESRLEELQRGPRPQEIEQAESMVRELEALFALRQSTVRRTERLVQSSSISEQERDESFASLEATQAQLMSARKTLELLQEGTRKEQIDSQAAIVSSLRSQLDKADVVISDHRITAPFGGHVQTRFVDEGVIVTPGQPIVEIVESGSLEVHVGLPVGMIDPFTLRSARIICGAEPVYADPIRIAPTIDQRTRNLEVVFALSSPSAGCQIGEVVDVAVELPVDRSGWWVPSSALVPAARGLWSLMIAQPVATAEDELRDVSSDGAILDDMSESVGGKAIMSGEKLAVLSSNESSTRRVGVRQVELLRSSGDWSQVQGSLSPDDLIILNGSHRVTKGQLVRCLIESELSLKSAIDN